MKQENIICEGIKNDAFDNGYDSNVNNEMNNVIKVFTVETTPEVKLEHQKYDKNTDMLPIETEFRKKYASYDISNKTTLNVDAFESPTTRYTDAHAASSNPENEFLPPDGGWGWVVCLASTYARGMVGGMANTFGITYAFILKEYDNGDHNIVFKTCKCLSASWLVMQCQTEN